MPNIDFSKVMTAAVRAQRREDERQTARKAEAAQLVESAFDRRPADRTKLDRSRRRGRAISGRDGSVSGLQALGRRHV